MAQGNLQFARRSYKDARELVNVQGNHHLARNMLLARR